MEKQMKAERERRETLLQAEGHKQAVITRAEGDKMAVILEAEGERDARIARAEGEAKAIKLAKEAEAEGIRLINEARPSAQAIELKRYEALVGMSNSASAKIIVPTDVVSVAKNNVLFSEMTGLGDHTNPLPPRTPAEKDDPCCDEPVK
jgi:regulator of protease activity HflC (stomatin/prohibitin superfamily)